MSRRSPNRPSRSRRNSDNGSDDYYNDENAAPGPSNSRARRSPRRGSDNDDDMIPGPSNRNYNTGPGIRFSPGQNKYVFDDEPPQPRSILRRSQPQNNQGYPLGPSNSSEHNFAHEDNDYARQQNYAMPFANYNNYFPVPPQYPPYYVPAPPGYGFQNAFVHPWTIPAVPRLPVENPGGYVVPPSPPPRPTSNPSPRRSRSRSSTPRQPLRELNRSQSRSPQAMTPGGRVLDVITLSSDTDEDEVPRENARPRRRRTASRSPVAVPPSRQQSPRNSVWFPEAFLEPNATVREVTPEEVSPLRPHGIPRSPPPDSCWPIYPQAYTDIAQNQKTGWVPLCNLPQCVVPRHWFPPPSSPEEEDQPRQSSPEYWPQHRQSPSENGPQHRQSPSDRSQHRQSPSEKSPKSSQSSPRSEELKALSSHESESEVDESDYIIPAKYDEEGRIIAYPKEGCETGRPGTKPFKRYQRQISSQRITAPLTRKRSDRVLQRKVAPAPPEAPRRKMLAVMKVRPSASQTTQSRKRSRNFLRSSGSNRSSAKRHRFYRSDAPMDCGTQARNYNFENVPPAEPEYSPSVSGSDDDDDEQSDQN